MTRKAAKTHWTVALAAAAMFAATAPAQAESGPYVGASIGSATLSADVPDAGLGEVFAFDESDFAWKVFGGFNFDLAVLDLGVEGGYVDLGAPSGTFLGENFEIDANGWDVFGVAGVNLGPVGIFGKAGVISWDADLSVSGFDVGSEDGSDPAYGIGARIGLGSLEIRAEYEYFDIDDTDDVYMLSAGLVYRFF